MGDRFVKLATLILQDIEIGEKDADITGSLLPFLACKNLQEFEILVEADFVCSISDDDIARMAGAWPLLRKFVIRYGDFTKRAAAGTEVSDLIPFSFLSIASLVQHCPLLRTLSLSTITSNVPVLGNYSQNEGTFRLDNLDLGYSLVTDENDFASLLRDLCPAHRVKWHDVQKLTALKMTLGALQLEAQTQRAEELRRRVDQLVKEMEHSKRRHHPEDIQILQRQIEALRMEKGALKTENEALRSGAAFVQSSEEIQM